MTEGYLTLTEKEKQTLRLLVSGYDAKSMARHLGLSVHTINERLRDARRKMAVSSSREAARQLRAVESETPQLLEDKTLGGAAPGAIDEQLHHHERPDGGMRRTSLIIGGVMMSFALALIAYAALSGGAQTTNQPAPAAAAETAPVAAARQFLALIDASVWQASYRATGKAFQSLNTPATWAEVSQRVRPPLGAVRSRQLLSAEFPPVPPQGYWIVKFRTDYANKTGALETLSLVSEDGGWKVVGVTIE